MSNKTTESSNTDEQPAATKTWRQLLIEAAQHGMSDQAAAEYAGLTPEEAEQRFHDDESLEREFLAARRAAMLRHIQAIEQVPQWQGHQYMLERQWPEEFGEKPKDSEAHAPGEQDPKIKESLNKVPTQQLQDMGGVIARGARTEDDNVTR